MKHEFWHERWEKNEIGFHLDKVHPSLARVVKERSLKGRVFVPLCGKTLDIGFLLEQGFDVVANELSALAVDQLFETLQLTPDISPWLQDGEKIGSCYRAGALTVWVGDYFKLTPDELGNIDWVYDRAAVIALPDTMRADYVALMQSIVPEGEKWVVTLEYDQAEMAGPPFSVTKSELEALYGPRNRLSVFERQDILEQEPRFKARGLTSFFQGVYCIKPQQT